VNGSSGDIVDGRTRPRTGRPSALWRGRAETCPSPLYARPERTRNDGSADAGPHNNTGEGLLTGACYATGGTYGSNAGPDPPVGSGAEGADRPITCDVRVNGELCPALAKCGRPQAFRSSTSSLIPSRSAKLVFRAKRRLAISSAFCSKQGTPHAVQWDSVPRVDCRLVASSSRSPLDDLDGPSAK
jgi:hypothetical protein